MSSPAKARVLIADDHALVAEGIARILTPMCDVVGIVQNGRALLEDAARLQPDLVCLDISMPEMNGIKAAMKLSEMFPALKLVFVTQQLDRVYVRAALRAGASAYVSKQSASSEILTAVEAVLQGKLFITPLLAEEASLWSKELAHDPEKMFAESLTERQRQVLKLTAEGKSVKDISAALAISPKTVEFHKAALMNELGLHTTAQLTRYAIAHEIV